MNDTDRQKLLSTAFQDVETVVGGHAMRPLSLASYDVLLRTGNPLVKGEMPMGRSWIADCRSWMKSIGAVLFLPSTIHNPRSAIFLCRRPATNPGNDLRSILDNPWFLWHPQDLAPP